MSVRCYVQAARRHYEDAHYLESANPPRTQNADALYGLSADSAAAAIELSACSRSGQRYATESKTHINHKWQELRIQQGSLTQRAPGLALLPSKNPFDDWDVNQRYRCDGPVPTATLTRHKDAAGKLLAILDQLRTAGVLL
ncbi:MAG: hypothetical protein JNJ46_11010 [Myxococcales bacterium]|nr:hypothetical protein [Myxococcales bacterium]